MTYDATTKGFVLNYLLVFKSDFKKGVPLIMNNQ